LGVLLFVLLAGHYPFDQVHDSQAPLDAIVAGLSGVSNAARAVLSGLLRLQPADRISLKVLEEHDWLQDGVDGYVRPQKRARTETDKGSLTAAVKEEQASEAGPALAVPPQPHMEGAESALGQSLERSADGVAGISVKQEFVPEQIAVKQEGSKSLSPLSSQQALGVGEWLAHIYNTVRSSSDTVATEPPEWLNEVSLVSLQPDVMHVQMVVPDNLASAVFVKAGVHVKQLAAAMGCKVRVVTREAISSHLLMIIGNYFQCVMLQELLHGRLCDARPAEGQDGPSLRECEAVVLVRTEAAGVVIGKQGFVLKQIRKQSGARIQLLRELVKGHRPCILSGTLQSVFRAERHVFDLVRAVPSAGMVAPPVGPELP